MLGASSISTYLTHPTSGCFYPQIIRTIEKQTRPIWRFFYDAGAAYTSIVYGLAGLAMFVPMPDENRVLLIGVYCTIVCAVATSTAFFQPIARWIIPALVAPTIIALMFSGKPEFWLLTLVIAIGVVGAVYLGSLSQMRYSHVSELNEQNKVLVTKLSAQQQVADEQRCLAEKAVIDKSRFIAAASHDLRQPYTQGRYFITLYGINLKMNPIGHYLILSTTLHLH